MLTDLNSSASSLGMFTLQDELLRARKELSAKENQWKREKMMLIQKTELVNMELLELRHRQANLKKVNDSLTLALSKVSNEGKEVNEFRNMIESLKSHTAMSNTAEAALKEERKHFSQEKAALQNSIRAKLEQEYCFKESALRARLEKEVEERFSLKLKDQEASIKKALVEDKEKSDRHLKQVHYEECQRLKGELERKYSEIDRLTRQIERLRGELEDQAQLSPAPVPALQKSTLIPGTPHPGSGFTPFGPTQSLKRNAAEESYNARHNNPNVATDLLCEICNQVYPVNQFHDHMQVCNGELENEQEEYEQENKLELIRQKKQIESQLNLLQKLENGRKPKQAQQVMYVISDLPKTKKSHIEKEIKNIVASICNQPAPDQNVSIIRYGDEDQDYSSRFSIKNSVIRANNRRQ